jgi:hypothetical protein
LNRRHLFIWLPGYIRRRASTLLRRRSARTGEPTHVIFSIADHFEPGRGEAPIDVQRARVARWAEALPKIAARHRGTDGLPPRHTFFYPAEEYRPELVEPLAELTRQGIGEVEIHLHHDRDTREGLREKLEEFKARLVGHGLLARDREGRVRFAFIHGNWALDNSLPGGEWCGVDGEISVLREAGCYLDMTFPAARSPAQTRKVNAVYYAIGRPGGRRAADGGPDARVGVAPPKDGLLLVPGPLMLDWVKRKWGIFPRVENAEIAPYRPSAAHRVRLWVRAGVAVAGRPEWVFVKLHTHGAKEENADFLLGGGLDRLYDLLETELAPERGFRLHYASAREIANLVAAAEAGLDGDPVSHRDRGLVLPRAERESGSPVGFQVLSESPLTVPGATCGPQKPGNRPRRA